MSIQPQYLNPGDLIQIIAPAKAIESTHVLFAKELFENRGYQVQISKNCLGSHNYFSGTKEERLYDLQNAINGDAKAILCARGGYGCIQLVDDIDWSEFEKKPKWIIGFSDVTIIHQRLHCMGISSIHGTMPLNFKQNSNESFETLFASLEGRKYAIESDPSQYNISGTVSGKLIGGNLAILYSLIGTNDQPDYSGCILYIEEIGEPLYSIDRMLYSLKKANILDKIKGLIVGGMTSIVDSARPFGTTYEQIILSHTENLNIPVCFNFPAGHIDDNRALILGQECSLDVSNTASIVRFEL